MNYIHNDIVKPFKIKILRYAERMCEMNDLANYLPPPSMKGKSAEADSWTFCKREFTASADRLEIKDGLPSSMQNNA